MITEFKEAKNRIIILNNSREQLANINNNEKCVNTLIILERITVKLVEQLKMLLLRFINI